MKTLIIVAALLSAAPGFEDAVLLITGAGTLEELDESTLERFRALSLSPLDLNSSSRSRLLASGLFSPFQVASLLDYRQRTGDILSPVELGLVDGFSAQLAGALTHFVRMDSSSPPGRRRSGKLRAGIMVRGSARASDDTLFAYGSKIKLELGDVAELNWGTRTTYSDKTLRPGTVSAAVYGRKYLGKVVLGHFGARFGQGLAQWSGFSLQPYGSSSSFRKSGTGFSPTASFSPDHCGVAADFELGRWTAGAAYSFTDKTPMASVSYTARTFTAGAVATGKAASVFWQAGFSGVSIYGELAWKERLQACAGIVWVPVYGSRICACGRYIDGQPELLAGAGTRTLDAVLALRESMQRVTLKFSPSFAAGPLSVTPSLRLAAKHTELWRVEGRGELQLDLAGWMLRSRLDIVRSVATSWLVNAEAGHAEGKLKAYLRWTLFRIDNWADRIYVYERDAPGSFNVPAYYGKGWSLSLAASWKASRRHAFHLRASYLAYPWMADSKPARTELKLQYQLSL